MHEPLRDHVDAIRNARDVARLLAALTPVDRTHHAGREWVRRWSPRPAVAVLPACGCALGRCGVCN